jgi:dTMP kinase
MSLSKDLLGQFETAPSQRNSFFITFEGIEGAGKSTQIKLFKTWLEEKKYTVHSHREPGGTLFGEKLREAILKSDVPLDPLAEVCLFASGRAQLLREKILPELSNPDTIVLDDRYMDSSLAYQGCARKLGTDTILKIHQFAPLNLLPHLTFYIRIDIEVSHQRQSKRGGDKDYFEKEKEVFYRALIEGYDQAAHLFPERFVTIDGSQGEQEIQNSIRTAFEQMLQKKK